MGATAPRATPATTKDAQILRFFRTHSKLARTPAGQREILNALLRRVARLEKQVRSLQAARAKPKSNYEETLAAVRAVFGQYSDQAMRVFDCETGGTYDPRASNGQYQGIAQMGEWERSKYGHGPSWREQAEAAWRYFDASGRDWSPWECKPW